MDQMILNQMLMMTQMAGSSQTSKSASEKDASDSFRKLLERQAKPADKTEAPADSPASKAGGAETDMEAPALPDEKTLENQMVLAAMAVLQNPVVPAEQTVAAAKPEQDGAAAVFFEIADAAASTAEAPEMAQLPESEQVPLMEQSESVENRPSPEQPMETLSPEQTPERPENFQEAVQEAQSRPETGTSASAESPVQKEESEAPVEADVEAPVFREVQEIPVKVGEAPAAEESQETVDVKPQLSEKLSEAIQNGDTKLELQLEPASLGKVTVEMTWSKDGALHIAMHAESAQTQDLLSRNSEGLQSLLSRDVRQEVRVEVPRQEESQRQQFYDGRQGHGQQERRQQEQRPNHPDESENFLHQLRLGLIPAEDEI